MSSRIMILSFWNPVEKNPQQGIFIQDQVAAVCRMRQDILFVRVNVLASKSPILRKDISEADFSGNISITINLYSLFWKFIFMNPWYLSRIIYRILWSRVPDLKPELIHSNVIFPCGLAGYLISKKTGSKLVLSEHWSKAEKFLRHPFFGNFAHKVYNSNEVVICVSEFLAEKIRNGTGHNNTIVIPNIVDTEIFTYKPKNRSPHNSLTFTCVASWKPPKRLDLIIGAMTSCATETGRDLILNVIGSGQQVETFRAQKSPGNLVVKWHGYLDKRDIAGILANSDFFLHASDTETFSIVTAEALSTGTPVLVSDKGALPELVHEKNGLRAENTQGSWNEKICEIINKTFDHEVIARENRERFSPASTGNSLNEVYNKVLADIVKSR